MNIRQPFITFNDSEFGSVYTVKKSAVPCYLFMSPPVNLDEAVLKSKKNKLVTLGNDEYSLVDNAGREIGVYETLTADDKFLARELPGYPGILEVATFKPILDKDPSMPETGDAIEITRKGFVLASQVMQPRGEKASFKKIREPIFRNANLLENVKQGTMGDCFLLSSVMAILHREGGEEFIRDMITPGATHTVVKLYDPNTLQPCYITVENSYYHHNGQNKSRHAAPWVHILEKAYTAFGFVREGDRYKPTYNAFREMFGAGGDPALAMRILTGKPAEQKVIQRPNDFPLQFTDLNLCVSAFYSFTGTKAALSNLPDAINSLDTYLTNNGDKAKLAVITGQLKQKDFSGIVATIEAYELANGIQGSIAPLLKEILTLSDADEQRECLHSVATYIDKYVALKLLSESVLGKVLTSFGEFARVGKYIHDLAQKCEGDIEKLEKIFSYDREINNVQDLLEYFAHLEKLTPVPFPSDIIQLLRMYAMDEKNILNFPLGLGKYSKQSDAIFDEIKASFANQDEHYVITASTHPKFSTDKPGLRNRHAYSVAGTTEPDGLKFIVLRNPWGHTGLDLDLEALRKGHPNFIREDKEKAQFELEVSLFTESFQSYSIGTFTPPVQPAYEPPILLPEPVKESFLKRHWGKILVGALVVAALVVAGIFSFGAAPAIAAGVVAAFAATGTAISITAGLAIGMTVIAVVAAAVGATLGAIFGKIMDVCMRPQPDDELVNPHSYQPIPEQNPAAHEEASTITFARAFGPGIAEQVNVDLKPPVTGVRESVDNDNNTYVAESQLFAGPGNGM